MLKKKHDTSRNLSLPRKKPCPIGDSYQKPHLWWIGKYFYKKHNKKQEARQAKNAKDFSRS